MKKRGAKRKRSFRRAVSKSGKTTSRKGKGMPPFKHLPRDLAGDPNDQIDFEIEAEEGEMAARQMFGSRHD